MSGSALSVVGLDRWKRLHRFGRSGVWAMLADATYFVLQWQSMQY